MRKRFPRISTSRVIIAASLVIAVYFVATAGFNFVRTQQLQRQEQQLQSEIRALQQRHERLQALKEYLNSDEYIETVARQQLGLVRDGEKSFIAISTAPTPTPEPGQTRQDLWWEMLIR